MKTVILAGGYGTRISEQTHLRPKPMVEIGGRPVLWHIMKIYSAYGINEFIICLGYKGSVIKDYFADYFLHHSDVTFDMSANRMEVHRNNAEPWKVTLVDTGANTMTGGRLRRVASYLDESTFCFTYGDGVSDVNITQLLAFHRARGKEATVTTVNPPGRFGILDIEDSTVTRMQEKPQDTTFINGGFFVLEKSVLERINGDDTMWEKYPMESLTKDRQIAAYKHDGFWQAMDTQNDQRRLESLWQSGKAPWKVWE